ncbi:MAG: STAS domain-containing protein [Gemmatimonadaceae bacterium]|nr:STAS domain-containing protein [Gemmatimonadaceae bacterium]
MTPTVRCRTYNRRSARANVRRSCYNVLRRRSAAVQQPFIHRSSAGLSDLESTNVPENIRLAAVLARNEQELLNDWLREQAASGTRTVRVLGETIVRDQSRRLLVAMREAFASGHTSIDDAAWREVREVLSEVSREGAASGLTPSETATFVFSLKRPLFAALRKATGNDANALADETWAATTLVDQLGLYTTEVFQKAREEIIQRQQSEMLELSTPVVKLWQGVLALPLIGTLDSRRTQIVMESLLERIVETGAEVAIIDITGVPTVDTLVAQHLIKAVTAARLMGTECIISGIRPQIAQTIVHLGVDLQGVTTKATLADAFQLALTRGGRSLPAATPSHG